MDANYAIEKEGKPAGSAGSAGSTGRQRRQHRQVKQAAQAAQDIRRQKDAVEAVGRRRGRRRAPRR
jgi:hypothetical protein